MNIASQSNTRHYSITTGKFSSILIFVVVKLSYVFFLGFEKLLGVEHPVCTILSALEVAMEKRGSVQELYDQYNAAVHAAEAENHPQDMQSQKSIDEIQQFVGLFETIPELKSMGRIDEAREVNLRVLQGFERLCGPDDVRTLTAVNALASISMQVGDLEQAQKLFERVLVGREKLFGFEHPNTLNTINNLATVLYDRSQVSYILPFSEF